MHKRPHCHCHLCFWSFLTPSPPDFSISSRVKRRARVLFVSDENEDSSHISLHIAKDNNASKPEGRHQSAASFTAAQPPGKWSSVALSPEKARIQRKAYDDNTSMCNIVKTGS